MPLVESGAAPRTPELAEQTCFSPPENESEPRRWVPVFHSLASWNRPAAKDATTAFALSKFARRALFAFVMEQKRVPEVMPLPAGGAGFMIHNGPRCCLQRCYLVRCYSLFRTDEKTAPAIFAHAGE